MSSFYSTALWDPLQVHKKFKLIKKQNLMNSKKVILSNLRNSEVKIENCEFWNKMNGIWDDINLAEQKQWIYG